MEGSIPSGECHWHCYGCGWDAYLKTSEYPISEHNGQICGRQIKICSKTTGITGYSLSCGKTTDTIESAVVKFN